MSKIYVLKAFNHKLDDDLYALVNVTLKVRSVMLRWRTGWLVAHEDDDNIRALTYWNGWPRWVTGSELVNLLGERTKEEADRQEVAAVDVDMEAIGPIKEQPMECIQAWVERDGIYWRGYVDNKENQVDTTTLRWERVERM